MTRVRHLFLGRASSAKHKRGSKRLDARLVILGRAGWESRMPGSVRAKPDSLATRPRPNFTFSAVHEL